MLISTLLKGHPDSYTALTQTRDDKKFSHLKKALCSNEESENCRSSNASCSVNDNVINVQAMHDMNKNFACFACGLYSHKKPDFPNNVPNTRKKRWCNICENSSHDTRFRRRKNPAKSVKNSDFSDNSYLFKVGIHDSNFSHEDNVYKLLVDCDGSKFVRMYENPNSDTHFIELLDGSRSNGIISSKADSVVNISDANGKNQQVILTNALCIPFYIVKIFSRYGKWQHHKILSE